MPFVKRRHRWLLAALLAGATTVVAAPTGNAVDIDTIPVVNCPQGHETATYHPGLTLAPQNVTVRAEGSTGPCVSTDGHTNAYIRFEGNGQLSCLGGSAEGRGQIDWTNPGRATTTFNWTALGIRPGGNAVLVLTGKVTSSDFRDRTIQMEIALLTSPEQTLACLTDGMRTNSGNILLLTIL